MTLHEFERSTDDRQAPDGLSPELLALWYEKKGDWQKAHELVQDESDHESAWVHAYLHRREGDLSNAKYWYRRCGRPVCSDELDREWRKISEALL
ncbi:MAG: hypothetical protein WD423_12400 [Rhodothermales bacterium]